MAASLLRAKEKGSPAGFLQNDALLPAVSLSLQLILAAFLGHAYDMRIFMATGYLAGTGQNPYLPIDLGAVFHDPSFQGITSFGYFPPWALVAGLIYRLTYRIIPNLPLYNFALKLPVVAANIALAYYAARVLEQSGAAPGTARAARIFLLFNPFLLLTSAAWGQFDPLLALLALIALRRLGQGNTIAPAILLALAVSLKPTPIPIFLTAWLFLAGRSFRSAWRFAAAFGLGLILFCALPFPVFGWDPAPILQHWDAHFEVGGGLSFLTFLEYATWSVALPAGWDFLGWLWVPALAAAGLAVRRGIAGPMDLLQKSAAVVMVFFLTRAWLSETNLNLVLPLLLILSLAGRLDRRSLTAAWVLPLAFSFVNTSLFQLLFPSLPGWMNRLLDLAAQYYVLRYAVRTLLVALWLLLGWRLALHCFGNGTKPSDPVQPASVSVPL